MPTCDECQRRPSIKQVGGRNLCRPCLEDVDRWMTDQQLRIAKERGTA